MYTNFNQFISENFYSDEFPLTNRTYYHGSTKYFTKFKTVIKANRENYPTEQPIYLTSDINFALAYSGFHTPYLMTVKVDDAKIFDFRLLRDEKSQHRKKFISDLSNAKIFKDIDTDYWYPFYSKIITGDYDIMETDEFRSWIKRNGFDGFYMMETNSLNLSVFDPNKAKIIKVEKVNWSSGTEYTLSEINQPLKENVDNELDRLTKLVWDFRKEEEKYWDWEENKTCFKGTCQDTAPSLAKYLKSNGFNVEVIGGTYTDVSDGFEPNMDNWDEDDIEDYRNNFDGTWKHWWVLVNDKWIVDTTSDQFHPEEEDEYRVIITDKNDSRYQKKVSKSF